MSDPTDLAPPPDLVPSEEPVPETAPARATTITPPPLPPRAKGHVPDTEAQRALHKSTKHLLGAPPVQLPAGWSLMVATPPFESQRMSSSCVGFALRRCIDTRLAVMGVQNPPKHSSRGCYDFARMWARGSAKTPLVDNGSSPSDAIEAGKAWGVCLEADVPSNADGLSMDHINDEPDFEALKDATAFKISGAYAIDSDGESRVRDVMHAISSGYPIMFAIAAGPVFESYNGTGDVGPETDPDVGTNHMVTILGYETNADGSITFEGITPWEQWGRGLGRFTFGKELLCDSRTCDLYAITLEPISRPVEPQKAVAP